MMLNSLRVFSKVFLREIKILLSDRNLIVIALIAPIFYSIFYGTLYINKGEENVAVVIYDEDRTELSSELKEMFASNRMIKIEKIANSFTEARSEIESLNSNAIIYIPKNFENDIKIKKGSKIKIYLNTTKFLVSNDLNKAINEITQYFNKTIKENYFFEKGLSTKQTEIAIEPIKVDIRSLYNTTETYGDFLIPAIMILILHQALLIALSESYAKERENKTFMNLLNESEFNYTSIILGKSFIYFILFLAYSFFFFIVNYYLFKINIIGNWFLIFVFLVVFLFSVISLASFVGSFFKRKIIALQVLAFSSYPFFLITGYSWPKFALPLPLKLIAELIPLTPFINAFTRITQMGADFTHTKYELIQLLLLALVYLILGQWRLKTIYKKAS